MKNLILLISLFFAFACNGQVPSIGAFQIPGIQTASCGDNVGYSTLTYTGTFFGYSTQESTGRGTCISEDGTILFLTGSSGDDIDKYTMSTAWDLSTMVYSQTLLSAGIENSQDVLISADGTMIYMLEYNSTYDVKKYVLSTPFDLSTKGTAINIDFTEFSLGYTFSFVESGSHLLIQDNTIGVLRYVLTTPYDIESATYDIILYTMDDLTTYITGGISNIPSIKFINNGCDFFCTTYTSGMLYHANLRIPYGISSYRYVTNDQASGISYPWDFEIDTGSRTIIIQDYTGDNFRQYSY
jgi:hypothetical protein